MRTHALALCFFVVCRIANDQAIAEELPLFGQLPKLDQNWKVRDQGKHGDLQFQWNWIVMTNDKTGDLLSFAAHQLRSGEKRELIYHSDNARELFPTGSPSWLETRKTERTISTIRNRVVKLNLANSVAGKNRTKEMLEYTSIVEEENGSSRMANGYVLIFGDLSVYVQHTSLKPITDELAQDMAYRLIESNAHREAATKDKPDTASKSTR